MNKIYPFILILSLVLGTGFCLRAEDSIPATDLQELVVKSERSWIENGVFNFIPTKKEKQLSNSPGSLIEMMHLPMLKGQGESITTSTDEPVDIFINGEPANQTDLATFWPKNVKKVEYMVNPTGGQYTGRKNVVNFVVADYVVGGVTKIYARQSFPIKGFYRVSSKLNYKKMSYGLLFSGIDSRTSPDKRWEETSYRDIFYNGTKYDEIKQTSIGENKEKSTNLNLALNARYSNNNFRATHTFGLRWNNENNSSWTNNQWSENLFDSESYSSYSKIKSLSPQFAGDYYIGLSKKWSIGAHWDYAYSSNDNDDWSQYGNNPRVENGMKEKVNTFSGMAYANYYLSQKLIFQLSAKSTNKWFEAKYSGFSNSDECNQFREELVTKLSVYWYPSPVLTVILAPGLNQSIYRFSDTHVNHINPTIYGYGRWSVNRKLSMDLNIVTSFLPGSAGETNPVVTKMSDLMWLSGNPRLKPENSIYGFYNLTYMPFDWLSLNPTLMYFHYQNSVYSTYEAAPEEMGGVIKTNANAAPSDKFSSHFDISLYFLNNRLSVSVTPIMNYFKTRGEYAGSLTDFSIRGDVGFTVGNFYLNASYQGKNKVRVPAGNEIVSQADQYSLSATYGWNDLNISFSVQNMFKSRFDTRHELLADVYSTNILNSSPERGVTLSLTYTFGYGKKVDKVIEISEPTEVESSRYSTSK